MPNNVVNVIEFHNISSYKFWRILKQSITNGQLDFNKFVPTPLSIYQGSVPIGSNEFGGKYWYDWNYKNWGTKWNAYLTQINRKKRMISFETAWEYPLPILVAIANKFNLEFTHYYVTEHLENWGISHWKNRERIKNSNQNYQNEGSELHDLCLQKCHNITYTELIKKWEGK